MSIKFTFKLVVLVAGLSALGAAGCSASSSQRSSEVARGERFRSGNADYDRFFDATYALQLKLAAAPGELADARRNLTEAVVIAKDANSAMLAERIKSELDRIGRNGAYVHVDLVTPASLEPSATRAVLTPSSKPRGHDANLVRQVENAVTRLLRLEASMRLARLQLDTLCSSAVRLEASLEQSFQDRSQREAVVANLRDAERMLALMLGHADEVQKPSAEFLSKFSVAVGTPWRAAPSRSRGEPGSEQRFARAAKASDAKGSGESSAAAKSSSSLEPVTRADFEP
ncbi:MAG: hypothetical protein ACOY0T_20625 [Myxococcota bacterium]